MPAPTPGAERDAILQRLDRLEQQNAALLQEIKALRLTLENKDREPASADTPPAVTTEERTAVLENRVEEQAQTKVEASQRFPIQITGTALFNAFSNGAYGGAAQDPTVAAQSAGPRNSGASFRQTVLGLKFQGPKIFGGGQTSGSVYMDFFAGSGQSLNHLVRLRVATIQADWKNTTFVVGQDKPIVSRREPDSLAQVGVSPLTGAGNPWLWQPQARLEQRFAVGENSMIKAEVGVFQTAENTNALSPNAGTVEAARPGFQMRLAWNRKLGSERVLEIAPVLHASTSHVAGSSVPSRLYGVDWLWHPASHWEVKGLLFRGENFSNLGALGGFQVSNALSGSPFQVRAIRGAGGWAQVQYHPTLRWTFRVYGGEQDDVNRDLAPRAISRNQYLAANVFYLIAPNIISAFEVGQNRTNYLGIGQRLNKHYDLALGYLF